MKRAVLLVVVVAAVVAIFWLRKDRIIDDAQALGLTAQDFPELRADVFAGMDQGTELSEEAIVGRNTWNLWTAGSQVFIDWLAQNGYGISDTLKMLDSRRRDSRFEDLGLINEPGFAKAAEPDEYGLWLDVPADGEMGRIDRMIAEEGIDDQVYGRSTGVLGLRLYPNPEFGAEASAKWDADRYYRDPEYAMDPELVRPYRVGMSCGVCHIAPNPMNPPLDPNDADWEHLSSAIGNQYFREGSVFASNLAPPAPGDPSSFLWEMISAQPPGTSDTSRMATDHINNPNAINAIFNLPARLEVARAVGDEAVERMSAATLNLPGDATNPKSVPHVLKDGADSVGVPGATIRVYVNIGLFSQYWLTRHKPILGIKYQEPFEVAVAQRDSVYWRATEDRLTNIAAFLSSVGPMHLKDAKWVDGEGRSRSGSEFITDDVEFLHRGGVVFAENCARCHSGKRPPESVGRLTSDEANSWFRESVAAADFRDDNFLSEDVRHPIDDLGTNAARALGTNSKRGRIWDNFSSDTYKDLPVGAKQISVFNPISGRDNDYVFDLEERGVRHAVGYYRTPSLIGIWSSAPFLHNNCLGDFTGDPSVEGRLAAFDDAVTKLLWPEKRDGVESVWRTQHESFIEIPLAHLPKVLRWKLKDLKVVEEADGEVQMLRLGPIPKGTPINLLGSLDLSLGSAEDAKKAVKLAKLALRLKKTLLEIEIKDLDADEARELMKRELMPMLLENSKCPDLVMDRGHDYGTRLSDEDKRALIEFLKTL